MELERALDRAQERRSGLVGEMDDVALHMLNTDGPPGARGPSFPTSVLDAPRPPNRTDSTAQPPLSNTLPLPPPPPSLSAELLELGDSLMKVGNTTTPYDPDTQTQEKLCSHHTYHSTLAAPYSIEPAYSEGNHRQIHNAHTMTYVQDHITIKNTGYDSKEQSYCHSGPYLADAGNAASCALEHNQNSTRPSSYNQEHAAMFDTPLKPNSSYDLCSEQGSSYPQERSAAYALDHPPNSDPIPPAQLCLPSPEPEPELLLSPVIPPGGPFTPSDPQSLEALDPTASAQLLDNIMAWFNNNINPQNNPQSLALIPSPPTTETDSSPDTHTETESESQTSRGMTPAPLWQPLEGEPEAERASVNPCLGAVGVEGLKTSRPRTLEFENREAGEECVEAGCVTDLSLDEVHTHPCLHQGNSPSHTAAATERDLHLDLQLEGDQSPEVWEEQVHLV